MPNRLPQPTRSRPLERIVRPVKFRSERNLVSLRTVTQRRGPDQWCLRSQAVVAGARSAPLRNDATRTLRHKVMILKDPEARPSGNYATDRAGQPTPSRRRLAEDEPARSRQPVPKPKKKRAVGKA